MISFLHKAKSCVVKPQPWKWLQEHTHDLPIYKLHVRITKYLSSRNFASFSLISLIETRRKMNYVIKISVMQLPGSAGFGEWN